MGIQERGRSLSGEVRATSIAKRKESVQVSSLFHFDANQSRDRKRSTYSIRPLVFPWQHRLDDPNTDDLTKTPAEIDVGGQVTAKSNGANFGGVCDSESLEDTPRNTTQNLRNLQIDHTLGSEKDSRKANNEHEASHDGVSVAEAFRDEAVDEETNDFSNVGTLFSSEPIASEIWRGRLTLLKPACHLAGTWYSPLGNCTPYFSLNCLKPSIPN